LDLTGSNTKEIIFPKTGNLTSVVVPASVETFRIYSNPGFTSESVIFENISNIKTVYIDCSKCGSFDVSEFCENLSSNNLSEITLVEMNDLKLTEETLNKLLNVNCILKGSISIINNYDDMTLKNINFSTKLKLVNMFGNIDTGSNGLLVKYQSTPIIKSNIVFPTEVSAYHNTNDTSIFNGLFDINIISGNGVNIIDGVNPYNSNVNGYLDIKYSIKSNPNGVTINSNTGSLTISKPITTSNEALVTITINNSISNSDKPTRVSFIWKAPQIGDFAYADGTFSKYYNSQKDLIGLVYAKNETSESEGTVYIIGKEYSNSQGHYSGYSTQDENASSNNENLKYAYYTT
jgi:hypothetical protein